MKTSLLFFSLLVLLSTCRQNHVDITTVRYEFTSDVAATYQMTWAVSDSTFSSQLFTGTSWTQSVSVNAEKRVEYFTLAQVVAYSPSSWANTATTAHVNFKIFIDGNEKLNKDTVMTGNDVGAGIREKYTF